MEGTKCLDTTEELNKGWQNHVIFINFIGIKFLAAARACV